MMIGSGLIGTLAGPASQTAIAALCLAALALPTESLADHDRIPPTPPRSTAQKLQPLAKPDRSGVTVSGLSSGGFFAHQFHIAHSNVVNGAGIIAGGPYGCVETIPNPFLPFWTVPLNRVAAATVACTHYYGSRYFGVSTSEPKAEDSLKLIRQAWLRRVIDDPANTADDRVWLFHGEEDRLVPRGVMETLKHVYSGLGLSSPKLYASWEQESRAANHGMPIAKFTGQSDFPLRRCSEHDPPYVIECGYSAAELLLRHLYPENGRTASDDPHREGTLIAFDQTEFFDARDPNVSLHSVGYAYVPKRCSEEVCRVHVALHGCRQNMENIHDDFVRDAGYNGWAASNGVLVLYPQVTPAQPNPNACWDFWGFSGQNYATKDGPQMRAVKAMMDRLGGQ